MAFKILGVDHIGVAVNDLDETQNFWTAIGLPCTGQETVAEQKVTTTFNPTPNGSEIELLSIWFGLLGQTILFFVFFSAIRRHGSTLLSV